MLDQNTDRMWYVIGAVIVGAALIFLVNSSFPQLFASVGDTFTTKTNEVIAITDGINPNVRPGRIIRNEIVYGRWVDEATGELRSEERWNSDKFAVTAYMPVKPGESYIFKTTRGTSNKRTVYFDKDYMYLSGKLNNDGTQKVIEEQFTTAPANAAFARISTRFTSAAGDLHESAPVDEWWFGTAAELESGK